MENAIKDTGERELKTESSEPSKNVERTVVPTPQDLRENLPGKKKYNSVEKRKMAFFEYLFPVVRAENERTLRERAFVQRVHSEFAGGDTLSDSAVTHLKALGVKYRVSPKALPSKEGFVELERKVGMIPEELALIQAANESSWGRSRFAKEGNNLFGQWCFSEGCGIVPKRRSAGSKHEVAAFPNVRFSVRSYLRNLNSHPAYKPLRVKRAEMLRNGKEPTAHALAGGLTKYAGIGHDYVKILRRMLKTNEKLLKKADAVPPIFSENAKKVRLKGNGSS